MFNEYAVMVSKFISQKYNFTIYEGKESRTWLLIWGRKTGKKKHDWHLTDNLGFALSHLEMNKNHCFLFFSFSFPSLEMQNMHTQVTTLKNGLVYIQQLHTLL